MILVIALYKTAYDLYRYKHHLAPKEAKWVRRDSDIRGFNRDTPVVAVGNWYEEPDRIDAKMFAHNAGFTVSEERI